MAFALSIRQPWAYLIINLPAEIRKDIENRTWNTNHRGELFIHASATIEKDVYKEFRMRGYVPPMEEIKTGGIIGKVNLVKVVTEHKSDWFEGPFGFVFKDAEKVPYTPIRGNLNIWYFDRKKLNR